MRRIAGSVVTAFLVGVLVGLPLPPLAALGVALVIGVAAGIGFGLGLGVEVRRGT